MAVSSSGASGQDNASANARGYPANGSFYSYNNGVPYGNPNATPWTNNGVPWPGSNASGMPYSNEGRQTSRSGSTVAGAQTPNSNTTANNSPHCTSPEEVFAVANALTVLFAANMTQDQLQTLINLLTFLVAGLSTIVTQQQICEGIIVQPPD